MSYQVFARKYRPLSFEDVVGQEHVTTTLKNAILQNRIHHAYLFTGVRGTGKTSLARIFAMALNAEESPKADFDPHSPNAEAIQKGQFLDVIEIDGASNTSVEAVRELREQVKYLPAAGKYKIYIIDEVHMLSTSAFNALLKTLEEPPPHVIFLFATTEAHKIPLTILSRCQRFDLRRLSGQQIKDRLKFICRQEKVKIDESALELLSRSAAGSLRDAQSLLDMAIGLSGKSLEGEALREMLGLVGSHWIEEITQDCLSGQIGPALAKVQEIYDRGYDLRQVALQWVDYLHDLALLKAAGPQSLNAEMSPDRLKMMEKIIAGIDLADLQVAFQQVYRTSEHIFRSEMPKVLMDLLIVKLVHGIPFQSLGSALAGEKVPLSLKEIGPTPSASPTGPSFSPPKTVPGKTGAVEPPAALRPEEGFDRTDVDKALKKHPQIKAILDHALSLHVAGNQLIVCFEKDSLWVDMFQEKKDTLAGLLEKNLGRPMKVLVQEEEKGAEEENISPKESNELEIPDNQVVRNAVEILNAKVKEVKKY